MKLLFYGLLISGGLAVSSCASDQAPRPARLPDTDVLLKARGYWEWESSTTMSAQLTPASVGFGRQLIFKNDGRVHIYHNRQPAAQPAYQLSNGVLTRCGAQPVEMPLVKYTAEAQFPNNDLRAYLIRLAPTDTTLFITGEAACVDGGAHETYRWRRN